MAKLILEIKNQKEFPDMIFFDDGTYRLKLYSGLLSYKIINNNFYMNSQKGGVYAKVYPVGSMTDRKLCSLIQHAILKQHCKCPIFECICDEVSDAL